ncbi:hypothetical protein [Streptomyces sp. TP-A0874]|uniref:hypothetical protein n=1 Tax=Streptomyces sp. TP-A0874 TaxID=549819 RepID=UPI000853A231|nr:hypothetical protein [Streptomyces sp. TP-A0874]
MSMRQISRVRRAAAAATVAAALAFTLSACGGDEPEAQEKPTSSGQSGTQNDGKQDKADQPDDSQVIATLKGQAGIVLDITSATRDSGGFVTVNGILKNNADKDFTDTSQWTGPELAMKQAAGDSLGGATLVDKNEKKRYYTLRDTENRPLASMGLGIVEANSEQRVFMQFPAPPAKTSEVDLQIPTFQSAILKLADR